MPQQTQRVAGSRLGVTALIQVGYTNLYIPNSRGVHFRVFQECTESSWRLTDDPV